MNKKIILPMLLASVLYFIAPFAVSDNKLPATVVPPSPIPTATKIANDMSAEIKSKNINEGTDQETMNAVVHKVVVPHVDTQTMARLAVGRDAWLKMTPEEKKKFVKAFTNLVVRTYSAGMPSYQGQTFKPIRALQPGQDRAEISSTVVTKKSQEPVNVLYRVIYKAKEDGSGFDWHVYDISVEGVSMVDSFRAQLKAKLDEFGGSVAKLIDYLNTHNKVETNEK